MGYPLISDIHGNLPALEGVLADIDARESVDAVYHLDDLGGYAPWPNEVVATIRDRGIIGIAGNYDSTLATDYEYCSINSLSLLDCNATDCYPNYNVSTNVGVYVWLTSAATSSASTPRGLRPYAKGYWTT